MKKIMSILGIAALAISLLSSGCSGEKTIKIGAILPLSGPLASIGKDIKFAIDIAVNDVNAKGGIRNKPVQVFFEDSLGIPENGIAAFEKLRQEMGVKVIIGACSSQVTLALAPYAEKYELPIVSPPSGGSCGLRRYAPAVRRSRRYRAFSPLSGGASTWVTHPLRM